MTQKILAHPSGNRRYRSIIRHITQAIPDTRNLIVQNVHNRLFDMSYMIKPDIFIVPIVEYTQEIHNYIENNNTTNKIVLYIDSLINQQSLRDFLNSLPKCSFICEHGYEQGLKNPIILDPFYDDYIYSIIPDTHRNGKVAVALSDNNDKNKSKLDHILYPSQHKHKIVLFNNPEFAHPQNIGIYNEPDLNYILNTFSAFVDMDQQFVLEAKAANIRCVNADRILEELDQPYSNDNHEEIPDTSKCSYIVNNIIVPFLGI